MKIRKTKKALKRWIRLIDAAAKQFEQFAMRAQEVQASGRKLFNGSR